MTNGEIIQKVFTCEVCEPIPEDDIIHVIFSDKSDSAIGFDWSWWNMEYKELATKNDLGVDCISRAEALGAIRNLYPGMPRVDFSGSLRKWVDKYKPYIECDDAIKKLPPVTPQEPFKPMVEIDLYSVIKQKYIEREVLDKIKGQIKDYLRGVEITLEVLVESNPLRPKMEGAKATLEECLELIDKAESGE